MKSHFCLVAFFLAANASVDADAKQPSADKRFGEYCGPVAEKIKNPQVTWVCTNRGYTSVQALNADLDTRNPRSEWISEWYRDGEPILSSLQGHEYFWDCVPEKDNCGIWVRFSRDRFLMIEQLLDRRAGNAWLGIGLSIYCGGSRSECIALQATVAKAIPDADLRRNGWVGTPPVGPAPPSPPPR